MKLTLQAETKQAPQDRAGVWRKQITWPAGVELPTTGQALWIGADTKSFNVCGEGWHFTGESAERVLWLGVLPDDSVPALEAHGFQRVA